MESINNFYKSHHIKNSNIKSQNDRTKKILIQIIRTVHKSQSQTSQFQNGEEGEESQKSRDKEKNALLHTQKSTKVNLKLNQIYPLNSTVNPHLFIFTTYDKVFHFFL